MKISDALTGFVYARKADGVSPATVKVYHWGLDPLIRWLQDPELSAIRPEGLRDYFVYLREETDLSETSLQNVWRVIRAFYTWAEKELHLTRADGLLVKPEGDSQVVIPFTLEEVKLMLKACDYMRLARPGNRRPFRMRRATAKRDRAIILTLLDTGIRSGECGRLKIEDVDLASGRVEVRPFRRSRKSKPRIVKLGKASRHAVWGYLVERKESSPDEPLFLSRELNPFDRGTLYHLIFSIADKAGVAGAHPHRFRHTFAIQYLRNGGDIYTLQELLGHSSLEMVKKYLAIARADIDVIHEKVSPVDRWNL